MKLPWASRRVLDDTVSDLKEAERSRQELIGRAFALEQALERSDARYTALLDKYHALRLVGGVQPQPVAERRDDPVSQAIIAKARGNPALYAHYATYVATQRAQRIPEDSIAQSILGGVDDDLGVPL